MSLISQGYGKFASSLIPSVNAIQIGSIGTLVVATPDKPVTGSIATGSVIVLSSASFPLSCKFIQMHLLINYTNATATASLPVIIPQIQVITNGITTVYPLTATMSVGTIVWANQVLTIPVSRTDATCRYTINIIGVGASGTTTVNVVGCNISYII